MSYRKHLHQASLTVPLGNPMVPVHTSIQEVLSGPVSCRLTADLGEDPPVLGSTNVSPCAIGDISPDGRRIFSVHKVQDPTTDSGRMHIDVWNVSSQLLERKFVFEDLVEPIVVNHPDTPKGDLLRSAHFMGNGHIVLGLGNGVVRVLSIEDGSVLMEARLGGCAECVVCSSTHLAVSLFPGETEKFYEACGIKFYEIDALLSDRVFEATDFVSGDDLSVLPNRIQFNHDETALLCRGSLIRSEGYTNLVDVCYLRSGFCRTLLREDDKDQTHTISTISTDGDYVVVGKNEICFYDKNHEVTGRCRRPEPTEGVNLRCFMFPDSDKVFLRKDGVVLTLSPDGSYERTISEVGFVRSIHFLSSDVCIAVVTEVDTYDIHLIDTTTMTSIGRFCNRPIMETVIPGAYDVSLDGTLFIGDREGHVRTLNENLVPISYRPTGRATLREILADPLLNRVAMLSCSQAVFIYAPGDERPELHIGKTSKKPVEARSGYNSLCFDTTVEDSLFMNRSAKKRSIHFDGVRYLSCTKGSTECTVYDYIQPESHVNTKFRFQAPVTDTTELKGKAIILLENGSLFALDPYKFQVEEDDDECKILKQGGPHISHILEGIERPQGVCRMPKNSLVAWTSDIVMILELDDEFRVVHRRACKTDGVNNVKWDTKSRRLIVAFKRYLSFWSMKLREMYRLYILPQGKHLVQVPYPARFKNLVQNHPGYFWSDTDCFRLFDVLDGHGNKITDERQKRDFLQGYFNEFMVREAITDYKTFCLNLSPERQIGVHTLCLRLPAGEKTLPSTEVGSNLP